MHSQKLALGALGWTLFFSPLIPAEDLSSYRDFQFGMDLATVADLARLDASDAKVLHYRPALIQELEWRPQRMSESLQETDPVRQLLFGFYGGKLFRILVAYDPARTLGLAEQDLVDALSLTYGTASRPSDEKLQITSSQSYSRTEKVTARWEDEQYSFNLYHVPYSSAFGLAAFSKGLNELAQQAILEGIHMNQLEAPEREFLRLKKLQDADRLAQENARPENKTNFRP